MREIKIYKSKKVGLFLALTSLIFVVIGVFLLVKTDASVFMSWASIIFFGFGFAIGIFSILDKRPYIVVNEMGIYCRNTNKNVINWEIIEDAYIAFAHRQKMMSLVVKPEAKNALYKSNIRSKLAKLDKALGFQELNIPLSPAKVNSDEFLAFVLLMIQAEKPDRKAIIHKKLPSF